MKLLLIIFYCASLLSCTDNEALVKQKKEAMIAASKRRVEKVINQLKDDCDSNLLKETYKRVQQRRKRK